MTEPLELLTPRLRLRRLRPDDGPAICAYRSLPAVARYQSWSTYSPADAARLIAEQERVVPDTPGTWLQLLLTTRDAGSVGGDGVAGDTVIGDCGIHFLADDGRQVELGITLSPAHHGRGLAAEALGGVLRYAFATLGKHRARAVTDAENAPAASLFRRLGFRQEAHHVENVLFKGAWGGELVFALLRREWEAAARDEPRP